MSTPNTQNGNGHDGNIVRHNNTPSGLAVWLQERFGLPEHEILLIAKEIQKVRAVPVEDSRVIVNRAQQLCRDDGAIQDLIARWNRFYPASAHKAEFDKVKNGDAPCNAARIEPVPELHHLSLHAGVID